MILHKELRWWYWLATALLLSAGLYHWNNAFDAAILLTIVQLGHTVIRDRSFASLGVQVRVVYLGILAAGLVDGTGIIHWALHIGTWAAVLFGYCYISRVLLLMPWNRTQPLTSNYVERVLFAHGADTFVVRRAVTQTAD